MSCRFGNIGLVCGDTLYPGGTQGLIWAGFTSGLSTPIPISQTTDVLTLLFNAYEGLKKLEGVKYAHLFAVDGQKGAGGNVSLIHRAVLKFITNSTQDDIVIQGILQATDVFLIAQNSRREFFIYGPSGMTYEAGAIQSMGQAPGDDISDTMTLSGTEMVKPLRFAPTGVTDIAAYLNARVV